MSSFIQMTLEGKPVTPTPETEVFIKQPSKPSYKIVLQKDSVDLFVLTLSPSTQEKLYEEKNDVKLRKILKRNTKSLIKPSEEDIDKLEAAWDEFSQII